MTIVYSPRYRIDIGLHVFPTDKYRLIHEQLGVDTIEPEPATWEQLALVHTSEYLDALRDGTLTREELAALELPWSAEMVDGFRLMVGGTILAARNASGSEVRSLKSEVRLNPADFKLPTDFNPPTDFRLPTSDFRVAVHIGGGLHHAFPNHGEGFCPFNDVAVAVRVLQAEGIERHAIVDLDVHHGNGTAFIFHHAGGPPPAQTRSTFDVAQVDPERAEGSDRRPRVYQEQDVAFHRAGGPRLRQGSGEDVADTRVFTFSMHQQHNYPMWKPKSSLDIGLPDGAHDAAYLKALEGALPQVLAHRPQCVFYLAGADPYEDDQLGGLRLTKDGLRARDRMVIQAVREAGLPLVVTLAGGYARHIDDTVAIHCATVEEAGRALPP